MFLQHGLFDTSDGWVDNYATNSVAFTFARAGYDVFLGNNRGNYYSNKHVTLDPIKDPKAFFNYSFADYGLYDLPAQIDKAR